MAVFADKNTRLIVQGITGGEGKFHTTQMVKYNAETVVGGVTPGKGGDWVDTGDKRLPVFDTVKEAVDATGANTSVIYVPARFAPDAVMEAASAGIKLVICITEGIAVLDMALVQSVLKQQYPGTRLIGPNCPGLITPGEVKVGIMPGHICIPGNVGLVSRSGTLTYEVVQALKDRDLGLTTAIGIGGDPIIGTKFIDCLAAFQEDPNTEKMVIIGEIGGTDEQKAAQFIKDNVTKPVAGFIAGRTAPPGKRMGHAGAIIEGGEGTAAEKIAAFEDAGVKVATLPEEVAEIIASL
jgi:succinyl-CoA synthetase alpha subunit